MANPCEVLLDVDDAGEADTLVALARAEAERIEAKFSRYRPDSVVGRIHAAGGRPVEVDEETAQLFDYAARLFELSEGRFDVTSGVLRRAWTFDGGRRVPSAAELAAVLPLVGWDKVGWRDHVVTLPRGMEIDLGGIGKEYAVDRAAACISERTSAAALINFGGDLLATGPRRGGERWSVGVDDPESPGGTPLLALEIDRGALATSGNARRYVMHGGRRLGHILDPRTGWPVEDAPRSVTVLGATCVEAGTFATLASLRGPDARTFLEAEGVRFWIF